MAEAIYYNIVTMSTVGYGDIHPKTPQGQLFAVFLIMMGGATFLGVIANATELLMVKRETTTRMKKVNMVLGTFFSETLLALFHLMDELNSRENFESLPESDIRHLSGDFNRAYKRLALQWLDYLEHLKEQYAYLFSLAARKNPFNPDANPVILD